MKIYSYFKGIFENELAILSQKDRAPEKKEYFSVNICAL